MTGHHCQGSFSWTAFITVPRNPLEVSNVGANLTLSLQICVLNVLSCDKLHLGFVDAVSLSLQIDSLSGLGGGVRRAYVQALELLPGGRNGRAGSRDKGTMVGEWTRSQRWDWADKGGYKGVGTFWAVKLECGQADRLKCGRNPCRHGEECANPTQTVGPARNQILFSHQCYNKTMLNKMTLFEELLSLLLVRHHLEYIVYLRALHFKRDTFRCLWRWLKGEVKGTEILPGMWVGGDPEFENHSLLFKAYLFLLLDCFRDTKVKRFQKVCWKYWDMSFGYGNSEVTGELEL